MRKILPALVLTLLFMFALAAPAYGDTPGCVTRGEFSQVHRGQTKAHVHRVFDTRGVLALRQGRDRVRTYRACVHPNRSTVNVVYEFEHGAFRVVSKFADFQ